eukprot:Rhum_TRINITY_DN14480_c7_g1::Rhum_TRINITY_DN14480_c7_g1_i1::g.92785::m.92785
MHASDTAASAAAPVARLVVQREDPRQLRQRRRRAQPRRRRRTRHRRVGVRGTAVRLPPRLGGGRGGRLVVAAERSGSGGRRRLALRLGVRGGTRVAPVVVARVRKHRRGARGGRRRRLPRVAGAEAQQLILQIVLLRLDLQCPHLRQVQIVDVHAQPRRQRPVPLVRRTLLQGQLRRRLLRGPPAAALGLELLPDAQQLAAPHRLQVHNRVVQQERVAPAHVLGHHHGAAGRVDGGPALVARLVLLFGGRLPPERPSERRGERPAQPTPLLLHAGRPRRGGGGGRRRRAARLRRRPAQEARRRDDL